MARTKAFEEKVNDLSDGEGEIDTEFFWEDDDDILISIYHGVEFRVVVLQSSYTPADVKEIIKEEFNLDHETYTLEYDFEDGLWGKLSTNESLTTCRKYWRRIARNSPFNLRVVEKQ